jgi:hypothetical protein
LIDVRPRDLRRKLQTAVRALRDDRNDALACAERAEASLQQIHKLIHEYKGSHGKLLAHIVAVVARARQEVIDPATLEEG